MKQWIRFLCLSLLAMVTGMASAQNVAKVGSMEYATLQAAFNAATDGQTVTLLRDYDAANEAMAGGTRQFVINKSITLDGDDHTLTTKERGIGIGNVNGNLSSDINVTIKNITIANTSSDARCIDTRGMISSLTLDGVTLKTDGAPSGYTQPLTIGGNQNSAATVNITNSTIQTNNAATAYYAIMTFNPVNMTISNSTIKGWACIYAKGKNSSAGSAGSTFKIEGCEIFSTNAYSGDSNTFGAFVFEDSNITVDVTNSNLTITNTGDQCQTIAGSAEGLSGIKFNLGEGNNVHFVEPGTYALKYGNVEIEVTGGTYNVQLPAEILPEGYKCVDNGDGTYTVKEIEYVAQIGEEQFETLAAAVAAANAGDEIQIIKAGDYTLPNLPKNVTIEGAVDGVVFKHIVAQPTNENNIASIPNGATFKSVAFELGNINYHGFTHAGTINMEKCIISGKLFSYGDMNFTNCDFTQSNADYNMWVYGAGNVVYDQCTFTNSTSGKLLHLYCENGNLTHTVTVKDCKFVNNGSLSKAAINVKATSGSNALRYDLILIGNNTYEGNFPTAVGEQANADKTWILSPLAQVDDRTVSPDNITVTENGVLIYPADHVAQIGSVKYTSLQSALDAAHEMSGDVTIELLKDIEGYSIVHQKAGLNLTINGAEKAINGQIIIDGDGRLSGTETLTIRDIKFTDDKSNFYTGTDAFILVPSTKTAGTPYYTNKYNYAHNVTVDNCSFTSTSSALDVVAVKASSNAGMRNVIVTNNTGTNLHSLAQLTGTEGGIFDNNTVGNSDSFVNVSGGKGEFTISNNTFTSSTDDGYAIRENAGSEAILTLTSNNFKAFKAVQLGKGKSATNGTINVVSGTYVGDIVKDIAETATGKIVITGGQFSAPLADPDYAEFIGDNLCGVNGLYEGDAPNGVGTAVVTVTDGTTVISYASFESAFAAAVDGSTITLLTNCEGNGIIAPQGKFNTNGVTVDFAGYTYTITGPGLAGSTGTKTQAFQLLKDNKITFKNGAIVGNNADVMMMIQNYSDLTLDNMVLDATQGVNNIGYVLSTNNGITTIKDTKITAKEGGFAFDADSGWGNYPSNEVTVTGSSEINGNIEVVFENKTEGTPSVLTLNSGTFNGDIVMGMNADQCTVTKNNDLDIAAPAGYKWVDNNNGTSTLAPVDYVAQIGNVKYETLQAALDAAEAANTENIVIDLLKDAELDITAWSGTKNPLAIGTADTKSITINGNNNKLTFNQKNSDWNNVATMNDEVTKLILNDMTLTSAGYNNGPWNRHDINFNCAVELNNVTSDKALAFKNDATLNNVTISDTSGSLYGIWIQPNGQNVSINGLNLTAERGIKIDDQYVDNPGKVNLDIANATFNTTKKSAIIVKSGAETAITVGEGINIENVAADNVNLVWVDEDRAEDFYLVTVDGATVMPESKESDYVACLMKGEQRWGFYDALADAIAKVEEGYSIKLHQTTTEAVEVSKPLTITKNGFTADNVTAGEGFVREETDDEIIIREMNAVAQIGNVKYETLAAAVAAVPADGTETTITMIDNETINVVGSAITIPTTKNVVLDLNGYQVVGTAEGGSTSALITNKGTLTIKDSSDTNADGTGTGKLISGATTTWIYNGDGNYAGSYASNTITNGGTLTIESGYIENLSTGSATYAVDNNSSGGNAILNMEGGLLKAHSVAVREFANSTTLENTVNVSGGKIEAGYSAIWIQLPGSDTTKAMKAALNVTGGTLEGGSFAFYDYSYGNAFTATQYNLNGGIYNGAIFSYGANIAITDGTFNGEVAIKQTQASEVSVSGGKFADDVYTYGDNASTGFITGGLYAIKTYVYEGTTYECDWTQLLAEGYIMTDNTDETTMAAYPWTVKSKEDAGILELVDGEPYPYPEGKECTTVTYRRTFKESQVDKFQPWFVPFDYTVTEEDMENFTFYKISMIAGAGEAGAEVEDESLVYIYITKAQVGDKLRANRPYVVKPNSALTDHIFKAENIEKVYAEDYTSRLKEETTRYIYNFYGNYRASIVQNAHEWLLMSGGKIGWAAEGAKLGSYRWYVKVTPRDENDDYSNLDLAFVEEDETNNISNVFSKDSEIDGIYTTDGIKIERPIKGINIIRFKNGINKKIYIK